jgi:hypothetical protein
LRDAYQRFQLNRLELDRHPQAAPALRRMQDILAAASPYGLIKEVDGLVNTVNGVNTALMTERRTQALARIDGHLATLNQDIAKAQGDGPLRNACLKPLEALRRQVDQEESVAHITQAEAEAVREYDAAIARIEEFVRKAATKPAEKGTGKDGGNPPPVVKKQRVIKPAEMVKTTYLETMDNVSGFLDALRMALE